MRIIAGSKRRMVLETPAGDNTRPTTDRIKETLFNMINPALADCIFVDFFAGSGQIGLEALSRGASKAYFFENNKDAIRCINNNIQKLRFDDNQAVLIPSDLYTSLNRINEEHVDIIFMDPPYGKLHEKKLLELLASKSFIDDSTIIIVEADLTTDFSYLCDIGYCLEREKIYLSNKHVFIKKA